MTEERDVETALQKLTELLEAEDIAVFTDDEVTALKEVSSAWRSARGFVKVASLAGATLKWCVALGIAWVAFKNGLLGSLK